MRLSYLAGFLLRALLLAPVTAGAQQAATPTPSAPHPEEARCSGRGNITAEAQAAACTTLIDSGRYGNATRAVLHSNRGVAYGKAGLADRAIAEFDIATRLRPN